MVLECASPLALFERRLASQKRVVASSDGFYGCRSGPVRQHPKFFTEPFARFSSESLLELPLRPVALHALENVSHVANGFLDWFTSRG
jgi:hypothetical protein